MVMIWEYTRSAGVIKHRKPENPNELTWRFLAGKINELNELNSIFSSQPR